jgi:stage II sporulation protein D
MKKLLATVMLVVTFFTLSAVGASAAVSNDTVKVGLRYGSSVMESANLENYQGSGYAFGYFDSSRQFVPMGYTDVTTITMTPDAWGGITVTVTGTSQVVYTCVDSTLGVMPQDPGGDPITWFKGYRYRGGFEYTCSNGGLQVVNVVGLEDYVKGVIPHEMNGSWPLEALKAQAVCARTFACRSSKHASYGFDVCATIDCQVYNGVATSTALSDQAVDETAGQCIRYNGQLIEAVYHSSDGGATEDGANVWGGDTPYLKGKTDPYEAQTTIPNYNYTVTYTPAELTWVLQNSGYSIGNVVDVYVAERSALGNVTKVVFVDDTGKSLTVTGQACSTAFYSTTLGKNVASLRFTISGGSGGGGFSVNGSSSLQSLTGASVISGGGTLSALQEGTHSAVTSSGTVTLSESGTASSGSQFVITGTGNGHNVGMSQYGAKAMAELGYTYVDILNFYYTGVTIG